MHVSNIWSIYPNLGKFVHTHPYPYNIQHCCRPRKNPRKHLIGFVKCQQQPSCMLMFMGIYYATWPSFKVSPSVFVNVLVICNCLWGCHNVLPAHDDEVFVLDVLPHVWRLSQVVLKEEWHGANVVLYTSMLNLGHVCNQLLFQLVVEPMSTCKHINHNVSYGKHIMIVQINRA